MESPSFLYTPYWPTMLWGAAIPILAVLIAWSTAAKGYALWIAARNGQKWWFIALLILNTVGILEVIYILFWSPLGSNRFHMKKRSAADEGPAERL
ncbi:MAG TPA: DUF5652 family protein [Candidatus Paceibacterota bacterium]|nr:DUF5652 family protein [Candidatus Paceibacterota bacterium]